MEDMNKEKKEKIDSFFSKGAEDEGLGVEKEPLKISQNRGSRGPFVGVFLALLVIVTVAAVVWVKKDKLGTATYKEEKKASKVVKDNYELKIDQGKYQAVFLTNGQVYFGKVMSHNEEFIEVTDIYYLQVVPVLQQKDEGGEGNEDENQQQQQQQTELSLVKLGNELHGPLDRMMLNKDQVMFIEDMKDDSKVTEAIKRYQEDQKKK